jgi:alkylation response protein AidB-like acyl-CoA dehydrogenase
VLVPEEHGGLGLGNIEAGTIMEEIGRNLTPSPFLSTAIVGVSALLRANGERKGKLLPKIAAGELLMALAVDERAKHGPRQIAMSAKRSGNGFALSGTKAFVVDGHVADLLIVAARTAGEPGETDGLTLFFVDPKTKGLDVDRTIMVDSHNAARLTFDSVQVDADAVLGEVDGGWPVLEGILNIGRGAVAAELVGAGEEAFGRTVSYLKERKQFGRAIGEFQALQHRAAHLYSEIEITRAAVLKALQQLDQKPHKAAPFVSIAKARAGKTATLAVQEAVQMHGGIGMTDAIDIGLFMKRVRVAEELFGDANFHADGLARLKQY